MLLRIVIILLSHFVIIFSQEINVLNQKTYHNSITFSDEMI